MFFSKLQGKEVQNKVNYSKENSDKIQKKEKTKDEKTENAEKNYFLDECFERGFFVSNSGVSEGIIQFFPFTEKEKTGKDSSITTPLNSAQNRMLKQKNFNEKRLPEEKAGAESPWWNLVEHSSRFNIAKAAWTKPSKHIQEYKDSGKSVRIEQPENGERVLCLEVFGDGEYLSPRQKASEPWVHLLITKDFAEQERPELIGQQPLHFSGDFQIEYCSNKMSEKEYNSQIHCAQTTTYFIFQNLKEGSNDYGDYLWFGIYIYDNRYRVPDLRLMIDGSTDVAEGEKIGTGKLIYVPGGQKMFDEIYQGKNPADFKWVHLEADLSSYVQEALTAAQKKGFLTETKISELEISHFNLGWEVTGTFNCCLKIKNLKLSSR